MDPEAITGQDAGREGFDGGSLFWTLLVSAVLAAPESEAAPSLVDRLAATLPETGDVLLAAAGPEAHGAAVTALASAELDASRVALVRLPTTGDLGALALAEADRAGISCVALLSGGVDGVWSAQTLGTCAAQAQVEAAPELQPASAPAPSARVSPEIWAQRERRFNQERLLVEDTAGVGLAEGVAWSVFDGRGSTVDTGSLAALAGDEEMLFALAEEARRADRHARWLKWSGVAALVASPLPLLGLESGAPQRNQDRIFTGVFIAGVGGAVLAVSPNARRGVAASQQHPANYYREEDAEDVAVAHNKALFAELQLADMPEPAQSPEAAGEAASEGSQEAPAAAVSTNDGRQDDSTALDTGEETATPEPLVEPEGDAAQAPDAESSPAPVPAPPAVQPPAPGQPEAKDGPSSAGEGGAPSEG